MLRHVNGRAARRWARLWPSYLACLAVSAMACTGGQDAWDWRWDVDAADRLVDEERYDEAMATYQQLMARAPDGHERRYLTYRMGLIEERRERYDEAIAIYLSLLDDHEIYDNRDDQTARALFRVGLIRYDVQGRHQDGLRVWRHVIHYYPAAEGPAHRALDGIVVHYEQNRLHDEAVRFLEAEYRALQHTRMGDNLLYWLGYWHRNHLDDPDTALGLYLLLRERYFRSSLRDTADWQIVEMLHARGEYGRELKFLLSLAGEREEVLFLGPVTTSNMEHAAFRAGLVRLEDLDDPAGAIEDFESFLDVWRYSIDRDNAARYIIEAHARLGDDAAVVRQCDAFLEDYPESSLRDEVAALLADYAERTP